MINKFAALLLFGMASPYQILDWYGDRHTCHPHTASGALAFKFQTVSDKPSNDAGFVGLKYSFQLQVGNWPALHFHFTIRLILKNMLSYVQEYGRLSRS